MRALMVVPIVSLLLTGEAQASVLFPYRPPKPPPPLVSEKKTDRENHGLVGLVHSVRVQIAQFSEKDGEWVEGPRKMHRMSVYDREGNMTDDAWYREDGSLGYERAYRYNADGNLTEEGLLDFDGSLKERHAITYDSKGSKIEEAWYRGDGSRLNRTTFAYNAKNKISEEVHYNEYGAVYSRRVYKYDAKGNMREMAYYRSDGSLDYKWVQSHDDKGNMIERLHYDGAGEIESQHLLSYDGNGKPLEETMYDARGSLMSKTVHTYDPKGNRSKIVTHVYNSDGSLRMKDTFTYGDRGTVAERTTYDKDGSVQGTQSYMYDTPPPKPGDPDQEYVYYPGTVEMGKEGVKGAGELHVQHYEFDSKGNWIRRTVSKKVESEPGKSRLQPLAITYRTITYYPDSGSAELQETQPRSKQK